MLGFIIVQGVLRLISIQREGDERSCLLCNLEAKEVVFIPNGSDVRMTYFGLVLTNDQIIDVLNGENWIHLYVFLTKTVRMREFLISKFNC